MIVNSNTYKQYLHCIAEIGIFAMHIVEISLLFIIMTFFILFFFFPFVHIGLRVHACFNGLFQEPYLFNRLKIQQDFCEFIF